MRKYIQRALILLFLIGAILIIAYLLRGNPIPVLQPAGIIARQQLNLIVFTCCLALIIVIPVFTLTFHIVRKYRVGNVKSTTKYAPDWGGHWKAEAIWWLIPLAIISVLAVVAWRSSHTLDPTRPLSSANKSVTVQVIALEWKWLFIYPKQNIASVNYVQFPADTPVNFKITADAPMNSFWIPKLGGQIYAMAGMQTKLHLMADHPGTFTGVSANLSGDGFADMQFVAKATTKADFDTWVTTMHKKQQVLTVDAYHRLAKPGASEKRYYGGADSSLFDTVIMSYMMPQSTPAQPTEVEQLHNQQKRNGQ